MTDGEFTMVWVECSRPKPEVWQLWMGDWWIAKTVLGRYGVVTWHDGSIAWSNIDAWVNGVRRDIKCDSIESGKAAAERHYRARMTMKEIERRCVMTDASALLAAILAEPEDDTVRLVYADFLDENDRPERAAHIRWAIKYPQNSAVCLCSKYRLDNPCPYCLMMGSEVANIPRRTDGDTHYAMNRGFVSEVRCSAEDWLLHCNSLTASHPIREVVLTTPMEWFFNPLGGMAIVFGAAEGQYLRHCKKIDRDDLEHNHTGDHSAFYTRQLMHAEWPGIEFTLPPPVIRPGYYGEFQTIVEPTETQHDGPEEVSHEVDRLIAEGRLNPRDREMTINRLTEIQRRRY
jgi:uncharacterized protein (TIGR02996 family)